MNSESSIPEPSLERQGGRLTFRKPRGPQSSGVHLRGIIKEFSKQARRRLMLRLASFDWENIIKLLIPFSWVTLTTPPEYWKDERRVYRALFDFRVWLEKRPGFLWATVRKERGKKRGMLHYHGFVFGCVITKEEVEVEWSKNLKWHGGVQCCPEFVRVDVDGPIVDPDRASRYLTKYCGKGAYESVEGFEGEDGVGECRRGAPISLPGGPPLGGGDDTAPVNRRWDHNGNRNWYTWGSPMFASIVSDETPDAIRIAQRVRRLMRNLRYHRRVTYHRREVVRELWVGKYPGQRFSPEVFMHVSGFVVGRMRSEGVRHCPGMDWWVGAKEILTKDAWPEIDVEAMRRAKQERKLEKRINYGALWSGGGFTVLASPGQLDLLMWAAEEGFLTDDGEALPAFESSG